METAGPPGSGEQCLSFEHLSRVVTAWRPWQGLNQWLCSLRPRGERGRFQTAPLGLVSRGRHGARACLHLGASAHHRMMGLRRPFTSEPWDGCGGGTGSGDTGDVACHSGPRLGSRAAPRSRLTCPLGTHNLGRALVCSVSSDHPLPKVRDRSPHEHTAGSWEASASWSPQIKPHLGIKEKPRSLLTSVTGTPEHTDLEIAGEARAGGAGLHAGRADGPTDFPPPVSQLNVLRGLEESQDALEPAKPLL